MVQSVLSFRQRRTVMPTKDKSFEESMNRLEKIINDLEENEKPLDETITLFEEGLQLVKACDTTLKKFESQINDVIRKNGDNKDAN